MARRHVNSTLARQSERLDWADKRFLDLDGEMRSLFARFKNGETHSLDKVLEPDTGFRGRRAQCRGAPGSTYRMGTARGERGRESAARGRRAAAATQLARRLLTHSQHVSLVGARNRRTNDACSLKLLHQAVRTSEAHGHAPLQKRH